MGLIFSIVKLIPGAAGQIAKESSKFEKKMAELVLGKHDQGRPNLQLPAKGVPEQEILGQLTQWKAQEEKIWKTGQVSGTVYHGEDGFKNLGNLAYGMFSVSNPLHPDVFPYVRKMEAEIVSMSLSMLHADLNTAAGTTTSGGTESILMAIKTYRDWAKAVKGITKPELVVPETIHAAFDKACSYFGIKLIKIPVNQTTFRADVAAMKRAVNSNTIAIAGSAPLPPGCYRSYRGVGCFCQEAWYRYARRCLPRWFPLAFR